MSIKNYEPKHEKSWVYCKALAYLFSDFWYDDSREKDDFSDYYEDSIELIALDGETVVGLLDIGIYDKEASRSYPYYSCDRLAYFANLAVHPDYQNQGIANKLFEKAEKLLLSKKVQALSIFTRGDANANYLYQKWGAELIAKDWLVVGLPKTLHQDFTFKVLKDNQRLRFETTDGELSYYQREGVYIVSQEEALASFEAEAIYEERTYLKRYEETL
ncbi:GNAT family N-acetyltransferase [Streptococcus pluranimalium]|uniref:GNAT family N-acetyltransferase n=1 Tax=Streptococcus pluranimalium TaxID=82348 RepID=UPI003F66DA5A